MGQLCVALARLPQNERTDKLIFNWVSKGWWKSVVNVRFSRLHWNDNPRSTIDASQNLIFLHLYVFYSGQYDDGDVFKKGNIISFSNYVHERTANHGVHFMMADGVRIVWATTRMTEYSSNSGLFLFRQGFSVEGQENIQEILSKRLYLCQFLVALSIVRTNGHFVCKLFDIFTPFSVDLVYIMYRCFKKISIHKPNTSRPANSER